MKACGIITEYNPFHYGHLYHLTQAKACTHCDVLVNVMSGQFVQRGEAAMIDKWQRAEAAIQHGCDLVIELPYAYTLQSADGFAYGGVRSLQLCNVSDLVFGSETNDIQTLQQLAHKTPKTSQTTSLAASSTFASNDILGVAYVKAIQQTSMTPHTIQRTNQYHDTQLEHDIASATAIRQAVRMAKDVGRHTPMATLLDMRYDMEQYYPYVQYLLLTMKPEQLAAIFLMDEGIEHLLQGKAKECTSMKMFVDSCISKRYTRAKIQRTLIHLLTQTTKADIDSLPCLSHIRLLAMNQKGRAYVKELKQQDVTIVSRFNQLPMPYRIMEQRVTAAYALALPVEERLLLMKQELQPVKVIEL